MLRQAVVEFGPVSESKGLVQFRIKAHFFFQPAVGSCGNLLSRGRVAAAGVCPQIWTMVFARCALLEEHFALFIENENTESPVEQSFFMGLDLLHGARRFVPFVDQYDL